MRLAPYLLVTALLPVSAILAAEALTTGYMLASSCAACHGTDGKNAGAMPSLQGKSANFIRTALKEFKSGASSVTVMGRLAKGYTDEEIEIIAAYFASKAE